jgi:hypothetical protein
VLESAVDDAATHGWLLKGSRGLESNTARMVP